MDIPVRHSPWPLILLVILCLTFLATHFCYLAASTSLPSGDPSQHLINVLNLARLFEAAKLPGEFGLELRHYYNLHNGLGYPPLVYLVALPGMAAAGWTKDGALMSLAGFTLLLMVGTFLLGRELWNDWVGLGAAVAAGTAPMTLAFSRHFFLDLPLTAMVVWGIWLAVRSRGFTVTWAALALGVWSGLGMLVKFTYAFYLAGPVIWAVLQLPEGAPTRLSRRFLLGIATALGLALIFVLGRSNGLALVARNTPELLLRAGGFFFSAGAAILFWFDLRGEGRPPEAKSLIRPWLNLGWALLFFLGIAWLWYVPQLPFYTWEFFSRSYAVGAEEFDPPITSWIGLLYYPLAMKEFFIFGPFFPLLIVGIMVSIACKADCRRNAPLLWSLGASYLLFTLLGNKDIRYVLPWVPLAAIFMTGWLTRWRLLAGAVYTVVALVGLYGMTGWMIPGTMQSSPMFYNHIEAINVGIHPERMKLKDWIGLPVKGIGTLPESTDWSAIERLVDRVCEYARDQSGAGKPYQWRLVLFSPPDIRARVQMIEQGTLEFLIKRYKLIHHSYAYVKCCRVEPDEVPWETRADFLFVVYARPCSWKMPPSAYLELVQKEELPHDNVLEVYVPK